LGQYIIGEVKNFEITTIKYFEQVYKNKFKFIDKYSDSAFEQLKYLIPQTYNKVDKVLFCLATTDEVYNYALDKHEIKIVTVGQIIKSMAKNVKDNERN